MIKAQGGDNDAPLPVAKEKIEIKADSSGKLLTLDALKVGISAWRLGAGRQKQGEVLQLGAGIEIHAKPGDIVKAGQKILTLHSDEPVRFDRAKDALVDAFSIGGIDDPIKRLPLVIERIEG
jgi:thymidine phosphorylase